MRDVSFDPMRYAFGNGLSSGPSEGDWGAPQAASASAAETRRKPMRVIIIPQLSLGSTTPQCVAIQTRNLSKITFEGLFQLRVRLPRNNVIVKRA